MHFSSPLKSNPFLVVSLQTNTLPKESQMSTIFLIHSCEVRVLIELKFQITTSSKPINHQMLIFIIEYIEDKGEKVSFLTITF